jgi:D-alanine-D-alanine ligase
MSIDVNPDWWKTLFDEIYLLTDARSVCDDDITRREVDLILAILPIEPSHRILDLCCGHGRHSIEFCARGFSNCILLDYSQPLIDLAKSQAAECNYAVDVVCGDARTAGLCPDSFDHVLIMGNSLGYIQVPAADHQILAETFRVLRPGGWLLVDVTDGEAVKNKFSPYSWHEIGADTVVCRRRKLEGDRVVAREMVLSKENGLIRDQNYAVRLYDRGALTVLFKKAGYQNISIRTDFSPHRSKGDFGFMNHRMIGVGQKL